MQTGFTALHVAAKYGQIEFVREMLTLVPDSLVTSPPQTDPKKILIDVDADVSNLTLIVHISAL